MKSAPKPRKLVMVGDGLAAAAITIVLIACLPLLGALALGMRPLVMLAMVVALLCVGLAETGLGPGGRARAGHPRH